MLESCRMLHLLTGLKCPTQHDRSSAAISTYSPPPQLLGWPRGNLASRTTRHSLTWAEAGASQHWQLGFSYCPRLLLKGLFLKVTSGSHIGCNASPALSFCHCKICGLCDLLASTEVKMWSCLRRCLDCYQVGC